MSLVKTTRINFLFDFYQTLLTDKQRLYMDLYYSEDLSLGEISGEYGISRQAVYDNVRRTEAMLEDYELKLNLFSKHQERLKAIESLEHLIQGTDDQSEKMRNLLVGLKDYD